MTHEDSLEMHQAQLAIYSTYHPGSATQHLQLTAVTKCVFSKPGQKPRYHYLRGTC